jgi:5S rRNA maturation endonuclease (ribonuclease M5)/desulfoferrodoxin (superoxide reductase-like protein)
MTFRQYDFDEIKSTMPCDQAARELLGLELSRDNRCAATWRGGDNKTAVHINTDGFYDHVRKEGGSILDLTALIKFGGRIDQAQNWLGEQLGLEGRELRPPVGPSRHSELIEQGYREIKRYKYTDAQGNPVQFVVRMEHPEKPKEFLQCDARGRWTVKHVEPVLYNLPGITNSDWVVVVEGEKDGDTLIAMGIPATTCVGGSKKWQDSYSEVLTGKDIVLLPDNDEVGRLHMDIIGKSLRGKARSIRILTISEKHKGDVTDWVEAGGTCEQLQEKIRIAGEWIPPNDTEMLRAIAKEANQKPFCNYTVEKSTDGKTRKIARHMKDMCDDIHRRLLGFPHKIGEQLFDQDLDTGRVEFLNDANDIISWIELKTGQKVQWKRGDDCVSKAEFKSGLRAVARQYESISQTPDWPHRDDVYYAATDLPEPSPNHEVFDGLVGFFKPATPEYRTLLKTLFCAPLYYRKGIPRPMWIIDSEDGAGTGKTTIAETIASLYHSDPIQCQKNDLRNRMDELIKRIVSSSGRQARVFLLDNVTGYFKSEELSGLVTRTSITGKAPYGRGEESRPNNLTYIVTSNTASVDNDIAQRAYFIFVRRAELSAKWKSDLNEYIRTYRQQIFADMIDMLNHAPAMQMEPQTRFPEFETQCLRANCADVDEYKRVLETIKNDAKKANAEDEMGEQICDEIIENLRKIGVQNPDITPVFIHTKVAAHWLEDYYKGQDEHVIIQEIRNLAKHGLLPKIHPKCDRMRGPSGKRRGILWTPTGERRADFVAYGNKKSVSLSVVNGGPGGVPQDHEEPI